MANNSVLVLGASGQDGSITCRKLLESDFQVFGLVKNKANINNHIDGVSYIDSETSTFEKVYSIMNKLKPKKIFNFMGISDVIDPWSNPQTIFSTNFQIPFFFIENIRLNFKYCKFLQSSSSLIFGNTTTSVQNENTTRSPIYPYGYSKYFTDQIIQLYRRDFNLFLCSAIFYNHESEFRKDHFFSKKVVKAAVKISKGKMQYLELGNLNVFRDFGYAEDYIDACLKIIEHTDPDDYIISSGLSCRLYDFVKIVFDKLNLNIEKHLKINTNLHRKDDLSKLFGDNKKIMSLGWSPKTSIDEIIEKMIEYELRNIDE